MSDHKLEIILAAKDATHKAFASATTRVAGFVKRVASMQTVMVGAAGAAGIGYFIKKQLEGADAIAKYADMVGVSTRTLQEYRYMAERAGVSSQQLDAGLGAFSKRLGELRAGTGALNTLLSKNNEQLKNQLVAADSTSAALDIYINYLAGVERQSDKVALSAAAFSRNAGIAMSNVVKGGSKAVDGLRQDFERLGIAIDDKFLRQSEAAVDQFANLEFVIKSKLMGAVVEAAPEITEMVGNLADWISENDTFLAQDVPGHVKNIATGIKDMAGNVSDFVNSPEYAAIKEYWEVIAGAAVGLRVGGLPGAVGGGLMGAAWKGKKDYDSKTEAEKELQVLELTLKTYEDLGLHDTRRTNELREQIQLLKAEIQHVNTLGDEYKGIHEPFEILGKMALTPCFGDNENFGL